MELDGLKPHTHAERQDVVDRLLPLWQRKFGANLLGVAACASFARAQDKPFSDLELDVFLHEMLPPSEKHYYQAIVDGLLIEAVYTTPALYLAEFESISKDWYISGSDVLVPVLNAPLIDELNQMRTAIQYPRQDFVQQAARIFVEVQEAVGKVLNAVEVEHSSAVGLLLWDAVRQMLIVLAFLNQHAYTTLASFICEAQGFDLKPTSFDDLLDMVTEGAYQDFDLVRSTVEQVFAGFEEIFFAEGITLYQSSLEDDLYG